MVGLGGFLGATARHGVNLLVARAWSRSFPLATFLINVTGAFLLGLFMTLAMERGAFGPTPRLLVATGFLGAYTTFSTLEYESHRLAQAGSPGWALANLVGSVVVGYLAVVLGVRLAR
jgi:CrcB protein